MKDDDSVKILQQSRAAVGATIARTEAQLGKLRTVAASLDQALSLYRGGAGAGQGVRAPKASGKAPAGALKQAILGILAKAKTPLGNGEVRAAIEATGYAHSLGPMHVGKTLAKLADARKLTRTGRNSGAKYSLARKA
jgi:hypothetical protein